MQLHAGDSAPNFSARDVFGRTFALDALRGQPVLLSFYRSAACRLCNLRLWYLNQQYPMLAARGLRIVGVFETSHATTIEYASSVLDNFTVIADPTKRVFDLYSARRGSFFGFARAHLLRLSEYAEARRKRLGSKTDGGLLQLPADFLLTPDLQVSVAYYGRDIGDFLPFAAITDFLARV